MRSYPSWIAGLAYKAPDGTDRAKYCAGLSIGARLSLLPEPDNRHDPDAVAILHGGRHLGYVPARHNWVRQAISEGKTLHCDVIDIEIVGGFLTGGRRAEHVETRITVLPRVPSAEEIAAARQRALRKDLEDRARKVCHDGLRVLAYLATIGMRSAEEHNLELSVIESRLIAGGFDRDTDLLAMLGEQAAALSVSKAAMTRSVNVLAKDEAYFRLVYDAARHIAEIDGDTDPKESEVFDRLTKAGKANGWL